MTIADPRPMPPLPPDVVTPLAASLAPETEPCCCHKGDMCCPTCHIGSHATDYAYLVILSGGRTMLILDRRTAFATAERHGGILVALPMLACHLVTRDVTVIGGIDG